jgi:hypothetical protein
VPAPAPAPKPAAASAAKKAPKVAKAAPVATGQAPAAASPAAAPPPSPPATAKNYDKFARCLAKKGATMYGAFWCPHCAEQKEMFPGSSISYLNYVECGVVGAPRTEQTPECKAREIHRYPTWLFGPGPNQERVEAIQSLEQLSEKTGCPLPK